MSYLAQACTVKSMLTTAPLSLTRSLKSPSVLTMGSVSMESGATTASVPRDMWGSAVKGTSMSVSPTPVTPGAHSAASSSPTTTAASAALDIQVKI